MKYLKIYEAFNEPKKGDPKIGDWAIIYNNGPTLLKFPFHSPNNNDCNLFLQSKKI